MFTIVITTAGVRIVTMAVVIDVIRAGGKLCLLFGVPSFLISVFNGLAVLVLINLASPGLRFWIMACLKNTL